MQFETALNAVRIVLVEPQHPGNIGAAARAMKAMGLSDLALVAPAVFPHADATARAAGADDLLANAAVHETLEAAVADCRLVLGTSARSRRLPWPLLDPRTAAERAVETAAAGPVAIVFGRERSGLTNAELDRCDAHLQIPCNPDFSSLNLAAAVQVASYELRLAAGAAVDEPDEYDPPATAAELEGFYRHLEEVMTAAGFLDPEQPKWLMRRLRRLFARAAPESAEINILRGLLKAVDPRRR